MGTMTTRSRIAVRWSTDPSDMGYGRGTAPERLTDDYEMMTPRQALAWRTKHIRAIGQGTFCRYDLEWDGRQVTWGEIESVVMAADWDK